MKTNRAVHRTDIAVLLQQMAEKDRANLKWLVGSIVACFAVAVVLLAFGMSVLVNLVNSSS